MTSDTSCRDQEVAASDTLSKVRGWRQSCMRYIQHHTHIVSPSAALIAAALAAAIRAAVTSEPIDVRTGPDHFTAFVLLVVAIATVPIFDAIQAQQHAQTVQSEISLQEAAVSSGTSAHCIKPPVCFDLLRRRLQVMMRTFTTLWRL